MRKRKIDWPHLQVGEREKRHDLGDTLARRYGVWVAPVACGRANVGTTLVTRTRDKVRCEACLSVTTEAERGGER